MRSRILLAAACFAVSSLPASAEPSSYGRRTVEHITDRMRLKDCEGAVDDLKTALKKGFPEVAMLAGSMYENGLCVKPDWERAVPFYIQAWQDGIGEGADRLAAGYADPQHGPDVAAALWWASRRRNRNGTLYGVKGCTVRGTAIDNMDRFVAVLKTWPQSHLQACNYMVGVMATIQSEVKYPSAAYWYRQNGDVKIRFMPGIPRIELQQGRSSTVDTYDANDDPHAIERLKDADGSFEKTMGYVAWRALRRYPHPEGIAADAMIETDHHFRLLLVNQ